MSTDYHAMKKTGATPINLWMSPDEIATLDALGRHLGVKEVYYRGAAKPKRAETVRLAISIALQYVRSVAADTAARSKRAKRAITRKKKVNPK